MRLAERVLYHQIHPLKLAADILAVPASLFLFWQHELLLALAVHFAPPVAVSAILLRFGEFTRQRDSDFGRYVKRMMTRTIEAARFCGDIVMVIGGWYHSLAVIFVGLGIVLAAWMSGFVSASR